MSVYDHSMEKLQLRSSLSLSAFFFLFLFCLVDFCFVVVSFHWVLLDHLGGGPFFLSLSFSVLLFMYAV